MAVVRVILNATAFLLFFGLQEPYEATLQSVLTKFVEGDNVFAAWMCVFVSLGLHVLSYVWVRVVSASETRMERTLQFHPGLYKLAHVSVTNFVLDTPGGGIEDIVVSHTIVFWGSLLGAATLFGAYYLYKPVDDAWYCYDPAYTDGVFGYDHGMCAPDMCHNQGIDCSRTASGFSSVVHYIRLAVVALFMVHLSAVEDKVEYYTDLYAKRRARLTKMHHKQR